LTINQNDSEEKTYQVALMRDIYRRSQRTIAWLDDPSNQTNIAFDALRRIVLAVLSDASDNYATWMKLLKNEDKIHTLWSRKHTHEAGKKPGGYRMCCAAAVLWKPWFSRMWIIQVGSALAHGRL
jgi:Heterokaryon incompatibility protein (HET)